MSERNPLESSEALWNRAYLDLRSQEQVAQILDRGGLAEWRELYARASVDPDLRRRILAVVERVPLPYPRFWLIALRNLGESVDLDAELPDDDLLV